MSYKLEGSDIVISGFENGIADSPYEGIADMRCANITSIPTEASVNFKTQALVLPITVSAAAFTAAATGDLFTWTPGALVLANGTAIVLNTNSATGVSTGVVYYVGAVSGSTFKLFPNVYYAMSNLFPMDITVNGSGTFSTYTMGKPMHRCTDQGQAAGRTVNGVLSANSYIVDSKHQVWMIFTLSTTPSPFTAGQVVFLGNIGSTVTIGENSICVWNNYLFLFRYNATDIWNMNLQTTPLLAWRYSWAGYVPSANATASLRSLVGQDDAIYICNDNYVGSILEVSGQTFDPTNAATYTATGTALRLPEGEVAICLAELGTDLLVGGVRTFVYPWDRISTSYNYPIVVPERYISLIVSTQSNAYIFAGNRGYIYITNGSNINQFKKIPDYPSGVIQPYYLTGGSGSVSADNSQAITPLGDAISWRNEIFFTFVGYQEASTTLLTNVVGVWAINLTTNAMRIVLKPSYDTYSGTIPVLIPDMGSFLPGGDGLFLGWTDVNGAPGIDNTIRTPYTNYETRIETDMIPVGTFLKPFSPSQIEWKTSVPIGNNGTSETVRISYRTSLSAAYTLIGTTTVTAAATDNSPNVSDVYKANFQKAQWVQFLIEEASNATTPTYNRLTEMRIRDWPNADQI